MSNTSLLPEGVFCSRHRVTYRPKDEGDCPLCSLESGRTTTAQRERLAAAGFVRVDGLTEEGILGEKWRIKASVDGLGRHDSNNGMTVIVATGGEVWLSVGVAAYGRGSKERWQNLSGRRRALFEELCPNGTGVYVPCSNGERLDWREVLYRLADPDWQPQ